MVISVDAWDISDVSTTNVSIVGCGGGKTSAGITSGRFVENCGSEPDDVAGLFSITGTDAEDSSKIGDGKTSTGIASGLFVENTGSELVNTAGGSCMAGRDGLGGSILVGDDKTGAGTLAGLFIENTDSELVKTVGVSRILGIDDGSGGSMISGGGGKTATDATSGLSLRMGGPGTISMGSGGTSGGGEISNEIGMVVGSGG